MSALERLSRLRKAALGGKDVPPRLELEPEEIVPRASQAAIDAYLGALQDWIETPTPYNEQRRANALEMMLEDARAAPEEPLVEVDAELIDEATLVSVDAKLIDEATASVDWTDRLHDDRRIT